MIQKNSVVGGTTLVQVKRIRTLANEVHVERIKITEENILGESKVEVINNDYRDMGFLKPKCPIIILYYVFQRTQLGRDGKKFTYQEG
jgi:hypothetical protein